MLLLKNNFYLGEVVFKNPSFPPLLTAMMLAAGGGLSRAFGFSLEGTALLQLAAISVFVLALTASFSRVQSHSASISNVAASILLCASVAALVVEFAIFGIPLLGGSVYNEFGLPMLHHLAVSQWLLLLFYPRHRKRNLIISLTIAVLLFNRQMALFTIISFLMTTNTSLKLGKVVVLGALVLAGASIIGLMRNSSLGVDSGGLTALGSAQNIQMFFYILLYLLGPVQSVFGAAESGWELSLGQYWNTLPEWMVFALWFQIPPAVSFVLFYGLFLMAGLLLSASRFREVNILGVLVHVYIFFSFFSNVLISTPIIASWLIVVSCMKLSNFYLESKSGKAINRT